jgi:hypothetical protein
MFTSAAASDSPEYIIGLDLGQGQEFTALSVVERTKRPDLTGGSVRHYAVLHLLRWPLGTPYTTIIDDLAQMLARQPLAASLDGSTLVVDATACGAPIVAMIRKAELPVKIIPATIQGGHAVSFLPGGGRSVPKKDLVGTMQALLQADRFKIAPALPDAALLGRELQHFRVKVQLTNGNETYDNWREREHDDLVLSVALACWYGEHGQRDLCVHVFGEDAQRRINAEIAAEEAAAREKVNAERAKQLASWPPTIADVLRDIGDDLCGGGMSEWDSWMRGS